MNKLIQILIILLLSCQQMLAQEFKEYYFKFNISDKTELDKITDIISVDNVKNNVVYAYATQKQFDLFQQLGYKIDLIEKEIPKSLTMATTVAEMSGWDRYPAYGVYRQLLKNYETGYPSICKLDSIGTTNNGRKLYVLKLSDNVNVEESEPEFLYTSTMHGDETTGFILMLRLIDSLLTSYNSVPEITNLLNSTEIYINPNANPDGTYYGGDNTVSSAIRSNGIADLNRDYPDPRTGSNAPYQPETQAMMDFAEERDFIMSANFHGGAEVMNYPWDTWYASQNLHADTDWFEQICTDYVNTARTVYASYMTDITSDGVTHGATWYRVDGGRQDYMNYWHQCREVTIELSVAKLLATENLNTYWNYNKQSLINYIKESNYGIRGTVKNTGNDPLKAQITVIAHDDITDSSMVFSNADFGDFYRLIIPGTYNIEASAYGYISDTIKNVLVEPGASTEINFILEHDPGKHSLSGIITDNIDNSPVEDVNINVVNAPLSNETTNQNGEYFFDGVMEDTLNIVISKTGYVTVDTNVIFTDTDTIFNFSLYPAKVEDFEKAEFYKFNWQFAGNTNWIITDNSYEGDYAAKSGDISDSQSSVLLFSETVIQDGFISFYKKVSSESGFDFLKFYIDGLEKDSWSGNSDWSIENYEVTEGVHTFKWEYAKDNNTSGGSDCAWIDLVSLPAIDTNLVVTTTEIFDTLNIKETSQHKIYIENKGNVPSSYSAFETTDWLELNKTSNTLDYKVIDSITLSIDATYLTSGYYNSKIVITRENQEADTVNINLMIRDTISSEISPNHIIDTLWGGQSNEYNIIINNNGVVSLDYNLEIENSSENNWISLNKYSGNLLLTESDTVTAIINTEGTGFGDFNCNIIYSEQDLDTDTISVSITVKDTISFALLPLNINDTINRDTSVTYSIVITNNGFSDINYTGNLEFNTESYSWITLNKEYGVLESAINDTINLTVNTSGIDAGKYICSYIFSELSGKSDTIPIELTVNQNVSVETDQLKHFNIYPNPSSNFLIMEFYSPGEEIELSIYNILGNVVLNKLLKVRSGSYNTVIISDYLNINNLKPGIYFIRLSNDNSGIIQKIIKE